MIDRPKSRPGTSEAGIALVHVIVIGAALFGLATAALVASRTDQMVSHNVVNSTKAFWIAAGGLDAGKAWLASPGNVDDPCLNDASCAPLTGNLLDGNYSVTLARYAAHDSRFRLTSTGFGPNNARKVVEEILVAPFFDGDEGLIQIDGDRLPADFEDPGGGAGIRIPDWTIDGRDHDPATLQLEAGGGCGQVPPIGGEFDPANTAMQEELDKLRCKIVQRANECCAADGTTLPDSQTCQWVAGFCQPGTCDPATSSCAEGTCDISTCYPGGCAGDTCVTATCPVSGCAPGSCAAGDDTCAAGTCEVDASTCARGTCGDGSCAPGTCGIGTCTQGTCAPDDPTCVSGWCKNGKCTPGGTCNGPRCAEATCVVESCSPGACNGNSCVPGTCGIVAGSCGPGACTASSCVNAACTIGDCTAGECTDSSCAAGSCTASCTEGTCSTASCIAGTCSLPDCVDFCPDQICESDPGLLHVRGDGTDPQYQTPFWTDRDLRDDPTNTPPGSWATACSAPAADCCESLPFSSAELRALSTTGYPSMPVPGAPSDRGPLIPDTPTDTLDDYPINFITAAEREALSLKIDGVLEAALAAPTEVKNCITAQQINGQSLVFGTLDAPEITIVADAQDQNPKMRALSQSAPCSGAGQVHNLTISGNSVVQGAGILILPRNLIIKDATFEWKGLIVVLERGRIETWDNACGGIWGGVLMQKNNAGNDARLDLDKNTENPTTCGAPNNAFSINYSCEAINNTNDLLFRTLAWTEVFDG